MDVPSALHGLDALTGRDSVVARLPEISVPSLVAVGQEDVSLPPPLSHQIHSGLPDSQFVEIPGAGHLSALEQPDAVNAALETFLQQVSNS
jgi:3-oxoadipate enol-lactonase